MDRTLFNMHNCRLCPRECGTDRAGGVTGFCRSAADLHAARAALLYYEEPCISGTSGSGAVFFTGCNLGCVFCQNHDISLGKEGNEGLPITPERLADIFLDLEQQGAANINLVTGSHYLHAIVPALEIAKRRGLSIPVVYNTASYEKVEALRALEGLVDIWLPDLKFFSPALGQEYAKVPDYFEVAFAAIREMVRQCPEPVFLPQSHCFQPHANGGMPEDCDMTHTECSHSESMSENITSDSSASPVSEEDHLISEENYHLMRRGVIVRHMVMPGHAEDSKEIIRRLYETFRDQIYISIMNQYTPMPQTEGDPLLSRPVSEKEYDEVVDFAIEIGVENGFIQEGGTVSESFIPAFDGTGITKDSK